MSRVKSAVVCVSVLVAAALATAEEVGLPACSSEVPAFCVDASYFKRGGKYWVEVYFSVTNSALQFVKSRRGEYRASADLLVILFEKGGAQVSGDTERLVLRASRYDETTSADSVRTGTMCLPARAGDFTLAVTLGDRDTDMKSAIEIAFTVPEIEDLPSLSDIRFQEAGGRPGAPPGPNVRRTYKGDVMTVPFYFEVYAEADQLPVDVVYGVMNTREQVVFRDTVTVADEGRAAVEAGIPADAIGNGRFRLIVGIPGDDGKFKVSRGKVFEVRSRRLYLGKSLDSALDLLSYIAGGGFLDKLKKAGPEERKALWEEFWKEKDPTPDTPENEFYEEHIRRFEFANERFGTPFSEGWKSDRGRIYIVYGEPDQVETYPHETSAGATEVWRYNNLGRRFVFVDDTGFGDYRLTEGF